MNFFQTVTAAVNDLARHGYDSVARIQHWLNLLNIAARKSLMPQFMMESLLQRTFTGIYTRMIEQGGLIRKHPGVSQFTLDMVKPSLRAELDRRILASANLIKINREQSISKTLQRFEGWSTSIPKGGTRAADRVEVKQTISKALKQLPFEERRVMIDQGHKFTSELNNILAHDGNAIAAIWHSHWRQMNYNYRKDHKERDQKVYAIRGNWAMTKGLMNKGDGYTDEMTKPGEEVFCRCYNQYIYNLDALPETMLTKKGKATLAQIEKDM